MRNIIRNLETTFSTVIGTIIVSCKYAASVFVLGTIGLVSSYVVFSSPAWTADYGFAFSPIEITNQISSLHIEQNDPDKILAAVRPFLANGHSAIEGLRIEIMRLILLTAVFLFFTCRVFNNTNDDVPKAFSRQWFGSIETRLLWFYLTALLLGVTLYHLYLGPSSLSNSSKYWSLLRPAPELWKVTPSPLQGSYWNDQYSRLGISRIKNGEFDASLIHLLYQTPYYGYMLYSVSAFMLLAGPALVICLRGLRYSTNSVRAQIGYVRGIADKNADSTIVLREVSVLIPLILKDVERYSCSIVSVGVLAWYEAILGFRTLALLAAASTAFTFVIFCMAIGTPLATLLNYHDMYRNVKRRYPELTPQELPRTRLLAIRPKGLQSMLLFFVAAILTWIAIYASLAFFMAPFSRTSR